MSHYHLVLPPFPTSPEQYTDDEDDDDDDGDVDYDDVDDVDDADDTDGDDDRSGLLLLGGLQQNEEFSSSHNVQHKKNKETW